MRFKPPKAADWFAEYAWVAFPESIAPPQKIATEGPAKDADATKVISKENRQTNAAQTTKSNIRSKRAGSGMKSVKFDAELGKDIVAEGPASAAAQTRRRPQSAVKGKQNKALSKGPKPEVIKTKRVATTSQEKAPRKQGLLQKAAEDEEEKLSPQELFEIELREAQERQELEREEKKAMLLAKQRRGLEVCMNDIEFIKSEYQANLETKNITQNAELTLHQEHLLYDPNKSQKRNSENFVLKPDPILALDRVVGIHPRFSAGVVQFNKDAKLASEILYCQANLLLGYHSRLQKQRLFHDKLQSSIELFTTTKRFALTFCKQPVSATANRGNRAPEDIMVTIWDLEEN